jgi:hypothetical protein
MTIPSRGLVSCLEFSILAHAIALHGRADEPQAGLGKFHDAAKRLAPGISRDFRRESTRQALGD